MCTSGGGIAVDVVKAKNNNKENAKPKQKPSDMKQLGIDAFFAHVAKKNGKK